MYDEELEKKLEKIDINGPAPLEEPERQYYFIKKCRKYVKEKSEELGRPLTACSRTFGCPKLDDVDYSKKLLEIFRYNDIRSITVTRMTVPCCGGLTNAVKKALEKSRKDIPLKIITISPRGEIV